MSDQSTCTGSYTSIITGLGEDAGTDAPGGKSEGAGVGAGAVSGSG